MATESGTPERTGTDSATLDDAAVEKLRQFVRWLRELRQVTSRCQRIQRGSTTRSGSLSDAMSSVRERINRLRPQVQSLAEANDWYPGMREMRAQLESFDAILNAVLSEGSSDGDYADRVSYLENINYEAGTLKGHLEATIARIQHDWTHRESQVVSDGDQRTIRRLTYDEDDNELSVLGPPLPVQSSLYSGGDVTVSINLHRHTCLQYSKLFHSQEHSDVLFRVCQQSISAHRTVLAAQSEYFNHLLFGNMREAQNDEEIEMRDVSPSCFRLLLQYAYTGCLDLHSAQLQGVLELIQAADRFCFIQLKDCLAGQLCQLIEVSSVVSILLYSDRLSLNEVERACLQFIDQNAAAVLERDDILTLPESILCQILSRDSFVVEEMSIYNIILRWMEHNSVSKAPSLLNCVRLSEIPREELVDLSQPAGKFTQGQVLGALRVQIKSEYHCMHPRGRTEHNANLFADKDSARIKGSVFWWQKNSSYNRTSGSESTNVITPKTSVHYNGVPNVPLVDAVIASPNSGGLALRPGFLPVQPQFQCIIALDDVYLLNSISFRSYPEVWNLGPRKLGFSYTMEFSKDGRQWEKLFDYSDIYCHDCNTLIFPVLATKYIKMQLTNVEDPSRQFSLTFASCTLRNDIPPVLLRAEGIIAPLKSISPPWSGSSLFEAQPNPGSFVVIFDQPYSITELCFKITGQWPPGTIGDVTVKWGLERRQFQQKTLTNRVLSDTITVTFAESFVNSFTVTVENVITLSLNDPAAADLKPSQQSLPQTSSISAMGQMTSPPLEVGGSQAQRPSQGPLGMTWQGLSLGAGGSPAQRPNQGPGGIGFQNVRSKQNVPGPPHRASRAGFSFMSPTTASTQAGNKFSITAVSIQCQPHTDHKAEQQSP